MGKENKNEEDTQKLKSEKDKTLKEETLENENELDPKTLLVQKKKMREQRDTARKDLEDYKEKHPEKSEKDDDSTKETDEKKPTETDKRLSKIEFAQKHPNIDSKVLTEVLEVAESKGITPEEALELPMIKSYLESIEDKKEIDDATPNSNRSPKIKPDKPISEMTREEHKAFWLKSQGK